MRILIINLILSFLCFSIPVDASESKIDHYAAGDIASVGDAVQSLKTSGDKIAAILKKESLTVQEIETVHEISYTIEAAVEKLRGSGKFDSKRLETLSSTVEEIHLASEQHLEDIVRKYFKDYAADVAAVLETEKATH